MDHGTYIFNKPKVLSPVGSNKIVILSVGVLDIRKRYLKMIRLSNHQRVAIYQQEELENCNRYKNADVMPDTSPILQPNH
jgi:hypothetical protein